MIKRSSILMLAIALLVLAAVPAAIAGPKGTDRPIKGEAAGFVQFGGEGNPDGLINAKGCNPGAPVFFQVTTYTSADGIASHLGTMHLESAHCNTPIGPAEGQMAFVAANGDVLYAEYHGQYEAEGMRVFVDFKPANTMSACYLLNDVPCESTGRFGDAIGSVVMLAGVEQTDEDPFVPWLFWSEFAGEVSY
jgi:hypothetical protein